MGSHSYLVNLDTNIHDLRTSGLLNSHASATTTTNVGHIVGDRSSVITLGLEELHHYDQALHHGHEHHGHNDGARYHGHDDALQNLGYCSGAACNQMNYLEELSLLDRIKHLKDKIHFTRAQADAIEKKADEADTLAKLKINTSKKLTADQKKQLDALADKTDAGVHKFVEAHVDPALMELCTCQQCLSVRAFSGCHDVCK